jgi:hypothetical protein
MPAHAVGISGGKRINAKCGADPPQLAEAEARVVTPEEFVDFLYTKDIFKQLLNPCWYLSCCGG